MNKNLFIFSFRFNIFIIFLFIFFVFLFYILINKVLNSNHDRIGLLFSDKINNYQNIITGNSRARGLKEKSSSFYNIGINQAGNSTISLIAASLSMSSKSLESNKQIVFIELTALLDENFTHCEFYIYSEKILFPITNFKEKCKKEFYLNKYTYFYKLNSPLFYRAFYSFLFKKNIYYSTNAPINAQYCKNLKENFSLDSKYLDKENYLKNINIIKNKYPNLNIIFFITPFFNSKLELKALENNLINYLDTKDLLLINNSLDKSFYTNCDNFNDNIHLSETGLKIINKFFSKYER
jgi:hypothetical protein